MGIILIKKRKNSTYLTVGCKGLFTGHPKLMTDNLLEQMKSNLTKTELEYFVFVYSFNFTQEWRLKNRLFKMKFNVYIFFWLCFTKLYLWRAHFIYMLYRFPRKQLL